MDVLRFIRSLLGLNPSLPFTRDIEDPAHGMKAKNDRHQKVIYDANVGKWVMPQNFSGKNPVTVTHHNE